MIETFSISQQFFSVPGIVSGYLQAKSSAESPPAHLSKPQLAEAPRRRSQPCQTMRTLRTLPSARQVRANRAPARPDNQVCPALQGRRHVTTAEAAALQANTQASAVSVAWGACAVVAQTTWTSAPSSAPGVYPPREWACPGCSKPHECLGGRLGPKGPSKGQKNLKRLRRGASGHSRRAGGMARVPRDRFTKKHTWRGGAEIRWRPELDRQRGQGAQGAAGRSCTRVWPCRPRSCTRRSVWTAWRCVAWRSPCRVGDHRARAPRTSCCVAPHTGGIPGHSPHALAAATALAPERPRGTGSTSPRCSAARAASWSRQPAAICRGVQPCTAARKPATDVCSCCSAHSSADLVPKKSGNIFRVGIFLDFVGLTTRAPHGGASCRSASHVRGANRNRIDSPWG